MNKSVLFLLFIFSGLIGVFFYVDIVYFGEVDACLDSGGGWNYEQGVCTDFQDTEKCRNQGGIWIDGENICDFGDVIN